MAQFTRCKLALAILPATLGLIACQDDNIDPNVITIPNSYVFTNESNGRSLNSVDFTEASTRLVLIKELSYLIESDYLQQVGENLGQEAVLELLYRIYDGGTLSTKTSLANSNLYNEYDPDNQFLEGPTPILSLLEQTDSLEVRHFSDLTPNVNLKSVMPGIGAPLIQEKEGAKIFVGWTFLDVPFERTPDYLIERWFRAIAALATDGDVETKFINTLNYKSLIENFLLGSTGYLRAINYHLHNEHGLSSSNVASPESDYTELEHNWDMAFGYFGAPINSKSLNSSDLENLGPQDANGDGLVFYSGEYNYWYANNAALRDQASIYSSTRFFRTINDGFLLGRALIHDAHLKDTKTPNAFLDEIIKEKNKISLLWDASLVAKAIHHINAIGAIAPYWELAEEYNHTYIHHWSELKSTMLTVQYNKDSKINLDQLESFHKDIGTQPNKAANINLFLKKLYEMRNQLQELYSFTDEDINNW